MGEVTVIYAVKHECTLHKVSQFQQTCRCGKFVETHSFQKCLNESPETLRKLFVSTKLPHQEIRWNLGILRSVAVYLMPISISSIFEELQGKINSKYYSVPCTKHVALASSKYYSVPCNKVRGCSKQQVL